MTGTGWKAIDVENAQKIIKSASKSDIEKVSLQLFEDFMSKLAKL
jgi:hypothetical protein